MKECLWCGKEFRAWRSWQYCCSKKCFGQFRSWKNDQDFLGQLLLMAGTDECIPWWGGIHHTGYGMVCFGGKRMLAHRAAFSAWHGNLRPDLDVMHACDNPCCINPLHLSMGTAADNMADAVAKGRMYRARGALGWNAKLTEDDVRAIRASSESSCALARKLGVNQGTISCVRSGKTWGHVQ